MKNKTNHDNKKGHLLVVDDDAEMRALLNDFLVNEGFTVKTANDGKAAINLVTETEYDLVITDLQMAGVSGMDLLRAAKEIRPELPVIMITAFGTIDLAVEAMRKGAYHFVTKPFKMKQVLAIIDKGLEHQNLKRENIQLRKEVEKKYGFGNMIGKSPAMKEVYDLIERVAQTTSNVLILGESGTGKELVARAVHYNSARKNKPFIPINCSAIPEGLLESELFGHTKGAFTGAIMSKKGLFMEAQTGTLFLDEIGDMSMSLQAKLLRVIQDKCVRPVGGTDVKIIDARIITASNKDLKQRVEDGTFRDDLYYRLSVIPISLPPLRARTEDIPLLAEHFLKKFIAEINPDVKGFSKEALKALMRHPWRGNVRELENVIERAVVLARKEILDTDDMPFSTDAHEDDLVINAAKGHMTLKELELQYISKILSETNGNKNKAAAILGVNRRTLYRKGEKYGLKNPGDGSDTK